MSWPIATAMVTSSVQALRSRSTSTGLPAAAAACQWRSRRVVSRLSVGKKLRITSGVSARMTSLRWRFQSSPSALNTPVVPSSSNARAERDERRKASGRSRNRAPMIAGSETTMIRLGPMLIL